MIEINLVPDVKQELLKAQRTRAIVITASIFTSIVAGAIVVLLLIYIYAFQGVRGAVLDGQVKDKAAELSQVKDLSKILTIQNQLSKISELNGEKYMNSRVFDMVSAITPPEPNNVAFSQINITTESSSESESAKGQIRLEGQTRSYDALEVFKKTIQNTIIEYTKDGEKKSIDLASNISTTDVSYGEDAEGQKVLRFVLSYEYPEELFSSSVTGLTFKININGNVTDSYLGIPRFAERADDLEGEQ